MLQLPRWNEGENIEAVTPVLDTTSPPVNSIKQELSNLII